MGIVDVATLAARAVAFWTTITRTRLRTRSAANAEAIAKGATDFSMNLAGSTWSQEPQKYHARSLQEIRRKYAAAKGSPGLDDILEKAGCLSVLRGAAA